jgi:ABC-2 type transport system ATP-binding protein
MYYLPERFQPPWYLTGYEFLSYALGLRAQSLDRRRADVVASKLTLDPELLRRRASEFSKGMTQKLGLVAAFLSNARMLVLDEPTSGLDPTARAAFLTEVEAAYIREQRSFLMTTHALGDATRLSGSVHACLTLMRSGRLVRQGQLPKLLAETRLPDLDSIYANAQ